MTKTLLWTDCETVGLCGNVKLIQFSVDDSPVQMIPLHSGWECDSFIRERLNQFFRILDSPETILVGFNIGYDYYHS
jgi:phosphatidylserine/phosphatidylglycerophosphate/cardiolipin synthase-like enzyme